jgi:hypothetical protein
MPTIAASKDSESLNASGVKLDSTFSVRKSFLHDVITSAVTTITAITFICFIIVLNFGV